MPTAELRRGPAPGATTRAPAARPAPLAELPRRWAWAGLAVVLAGGLALRLWGIRTGLPYVYHADATDPLADAPTGRALRLRGLNARIITAGTVRTGDVIRKVPTP